MIRWCGVRTMIFRKDTRIAIGYRYGLPFNKSVRNKSRHSKLTIASEASKLTKLVLPKIKYNLSCMHWIMKIVFNTKCKVEIKWNQSQIRLFNEKSEMHVYTVHKCTFSSSLAKVFEFWRAKDIVWKPSLFSRLGIVFVFNIFGWLFACGRCSIAQSTKCMQYALAFIQILWFHMPRQQPLSITWRSELNLMSICSTWPFSEITKPERDETHYLGAWVILWTFHTCLHSILVHVAEYWMLLLQLCLCAVLVLFDVVRTLYA